MEDQLAFSAGVASVDDSINILTRVEFLDQFELRFILLDRFQFKVIGKHREVGERPLPALDFDPFGRNQFEHVTDRRRHDVVRPFEEVFLVLKPTERPGDVAGHRGFLGNDQGLARFFGKAGGRLLFPGCSGRTGRHCQTIFRDV